MWGCPDSTDATVEDRVGVDRQAVALVVAFVAAGVFGLVLLIGGDWLPGTIIVVCALAGLIFQFAKSTRRDETDPGMPPQTGSS